MSGHQLSGNHEHNEKSNVHPELMVLSGLSYQDDNLLEKEIALLRKKQHRFLWIDCLPFLSASFGAGRLSYKGCCLLMAAPLSGGGGPHPCCIWPHEPHLCWTQENPVCESICLFPFAVLNHAMAI